MVCRVLHISIGCGYPDIFSLLLPDMECGTNLLRQVLCIDIVDQVFQGNNQSVLCKV